MTTIKTYKAKKDKKEGAKNHPFFSSKSKKLFQFNDHLQ